MDFDDRDLWGVYHGYLRSHSRYARRDAEDGRSEETLGLLEYALGYPLARVRRWLSQAPRRHLKRLQLRDGGAASAVVSIDSLRAVYVACTIGEFRLARDLAARIEDAADAPYIGTRSEVCTPNQQQLAYAVRAFFADQATETESHLRQVRRGRGDDEETLQVAMIRALLNPDKQAFLDALAELLRRSARRARKNRELTDQILCVPALGLARLAIEQGLVTAAELPTDDARFPVQLLSSDGPLSIPVSSQEAVRWVAHGAAVTCLAASADWLVSAGGDGLIRVWDRATHEELRTLVGHTDLLSGMAPLWEQGKLVSVSWDRTARVWDLAAGNQVACSSPDGHMLFSLESVARIPSSDRLVIGYPDGQLAGWRLSETDLAPLCRLPSAALALDVLPGGGSLLAATEAGVLFHWDLERSAWLRRCEGSDGPLYAVRFLAVHGSALSAGADGIVRMWDLGSARCVRRFAGHSGPVRCLAHTPDERWLFSGGDDGTIRVWDAIRGQEAACLVGHVGSARCVCVQDGSSLLSGGDDGTVQRSCSCS